MLLRKVLFLLYLSVICSLNFFCRIEKTEEGDSLLRAIVDKEKFLPTFFEQKS